MLIEIFYIPHLKVLIVIKGQNLLSSGVPENGKSTYLRLIRKDKEISMSHSADGKKWSAPSNPFKNIDMAFPDEVAVGVFFSHSTHQFAHATFDGFAVAKPK